jgi:hypothetical protein
MVIIICLWMKKVNLLNIITKQNNVDLFIGSQSQDEVLYCADTPIDTCGYFEGEDQCDCSVATYGESDQDGESEDEQTDDNYGGKR